MHLNFNRSQVFEEVLKEDESVEQNLRQQTDR